MANTLKFGNGQWATGNGTALAYNDENANFKPLPFDFTRASSGTTVNQSGLIETVGSGIPRIDFQGNTKGALLLEPSRSNSITYSENVLLWSTSGTIIREDNVSISPNGKQTASTITSTNVSTFNNIRQNFSVSANSTCTASLFIKKVQTETNYLGLGIVFTGATTDVAYISFDSVNGIARNMDSRITAILNVVDYGTYWRLEATATDSESNTQVEMYVYTTLSTNGTTVSSGASSIRTIWGMQLELNSSYATSYIPTSGSAVTRVAESCSQTTPSGVIGQTEGTLYAEIDFKSKPENGSPIVGIMTLNNNVTNLQNCIILGIERQSGGINRFYPLVQVGNSDVAFIIGGTLTDGNYKAAFAYKQNDFVLYVNGVQIGTDSSGAVPTTSQVLVGERFNTDTYKIADGIKDTKLYNTRLSNSELAALTQV